MAQAHGARLTGVDASSEAALGGAWGDLASRIGPEFEAAIKEAKLVGRFVERERRARDRRRIRPLRRSDYRAAAGGRGARAGSFRDPRGDAARLGRADVDPAALLETVAGRREHRHRLERQPRGDPRRP